MQRWTWRQVVCALGSTLCALVLLTTAVPVAADAVGPAAEKMPKVDHDEATLHLAMMLKTLADEEYLRGTPETIARAAKLYEEAARELNGIENLNPEDETEGATVELLRTDIIYRKRLIEAGFDFWGGVLSRTPTIPVNHVARMRKHVTELNELVNMVIGLNQDTKRDAAHVAELIAKAQAVEGVLEQNVPRSEQIAITIRDYRTHLEIARERLAVLIQTKAQLAQEAEQYQKQLEAARSHANELLIQGVAQAAGLPPEANLMVGNENIEKRLLNYVARNPALLNSPQLTSALGKYGETTKELIDRYQEIAKIADEVQRGGEALQKLQAALRNPSIESIAAVGHELYTKLPDDVKSDWKRQVEASKPAAAILEVASRVEQSQAIVQSAAQYLAEQKHAYLSSFAPDFAQRLVAARAAELRTWYPDLTQKLAAVPVLQEYVVDSVVRLQPHEFLDLLTPAQIALLEKTFRARTRAELEQKLAAEGVAAHAKVAAGKLNISVPGWRDPAQVSVDVSRILPLRTALGVADEKLRSELERLLKVTQSLDEAQLVIYANLPAAELQRLANEFISKAPDLGAMNRRREEMWTKVLADLPPGVDALVRTKVAEVQVGSSYMHQVYESETAKARSAGVFPPQPPSGQKSASERQADMAVRAAITAAVPAAGAVIGIADSISSAAFYARMVNERTEKIRELMIEEIAMFDSVRHYERDLRIADLEKEIAQIRARTAYRQFKTFHEAIDRVLDTAQTNQKRIARRRALLFFYAESLREEFDAFDRSMALWTGRVNAPRGAVAELIRTDPNNLRLALDRDIHLFDWLDREVEGNRANVDELAVHWRKVMDLVDDLCRKMGACGGNASLGQYSSTDEIPLRQLVSDEEWARFRTWQKQSAPGRFRLTFLLDPASGIAPRGHQNVRVADVRLGLKSNGRTSAATRVGLRHSGFAYLRTSDKYEKESLAPTEFHYAFNEPTPFDQSVLRSRWAGGPEVKANVFEGYGLYGLWQMEFDPDDRAARAAEDVSIRFAYHFLVSPAVPPAARALDPVRDAYDIPKEKLVGTTRSVSVELPLAALAPIGSRSEVVDAIRQLSSGSSEAVRELAAGGKLSFTVHNVQISSEELRRRVVEEERARIKRDAGARGVEISPEAVETAAQRNADEWLRRVGGRR